MKSSSRVYAQTFSSFIIENACWCKLPSVCRLLLASPREEEEALRHFIWFQFFLVLPNLFLVTLFSVQIMKARTHLRQSTRPNAIVGSFIDEFIRLGSRFSQHCPSSPSLSFIGFDGWMTLRPVSPSSSHYTGSARLELEKYNPYDFHFL